MAAVSRWRFTALVPLLLIAAYDALLVAVMVDMATMTEPSPVIGSECAGPRYRTIGIYVGHGLVSVALATVPAVLHLARPRWWTVPLLWAALPLATGYNYLDGGCF